MSPPIASEPLAHIVEQLKRDIVRGQQTCIQICPGIKANSTKIQLDQLSNSLGYGDSFVSNMYSSRIKVDQHADMEAAEAALRQDLAGFTQRINEMIRKLDRYKYPFSVHHDHMHDHHDQHDHHDHHDHHGHPRSYHGHLHEFVFGCDPHHHYHHHHHQSNNPHPHHHIDTFFANQIKEWESIKDGISQAFAHFDNTVLEKKREREEKEQQKKKVEQEKKDAIKKAEDREKEHTKTEKERAEKLAEKVKAYEAEQKALRLREQEREQRLEDDVHNLARDALNNASNTVRLATCENSPGGHKKGWHQGDADDDIDRLDRLTRVVGHLDLAFNHHDSHHPNQQNVLVSQQNALNGVPSSSTIPSGACIYCWTHDGIFTRDFEHHPHHPHHHNWSEGIRAATVIGNEEHNPPIVIHNNIRSAELEIEEGSSISSRSLRGSRHKGLRYSQPVRYIRAASDSGSDDSLRFHHERKHVHAYPRF